MQNSPVRCVICDSRPPLIIDNDLIPLCTSKDLQIANTIMNMENINDNACLERVHAHSMDVLSKRSIPVLPELSILEESRSRLLEVIPDHGMCIASNVYGDPRPHLQTWRGAAYQTKWVLFGEVHSVSSI